METENWWCLLGTVACLIEGFVEPNYPVWPVPAGRYGESGESDEILADVENAFGGSGDDTCVGPQPRTSFTALPARTGSTAGQATIC